MFKSRNFSIKEIAHRELPNNDDIVWLECSACFLMGNMQVIRDMICKHFKKDIAITITSGYRSPMVNEMTAGAAKNSLHMWRLAEGMQFYNACDFKVDETKVDPKEVFKFLSDTIGGYCELGYYPNDPDKHFHYSAATKEPPYTKM